MSQPQDRNKKLHETSEKIGSGILTLRYDEKNRLIQAEAKGSKYSAGLSLQPDIPKGKFHNNSGDVSLWEKGGRIRQRFFWNLGTKHPRKNPL